MLSKEKEFQPRNAPKTRNQKHMLHSVNSVCSVVKQNKEFKPPVSTHNVAPKPNQNISVDQRLSVVKKNLSQPKYRSKVLNADQTGAGFNIKFGLACTSQFRSILK